jgi:hypothetical protein
MANDLISMREGRRKQSTITFESDNDAMGVATAGRILDCEEDQSPTTYSERTRRYSREKLEIDSRHLEDHIAGFDVIPTRHTKDIEKLQVPGDIVARLQGWISAAKSQTLWISGTPFSPTCEASSAAAYVTAIAERGSIPCISFFCSPLFETTDPSKSSQEAQLVALLYSLIRQLTVLALPIFESNYDFYIELASLDGSLESIPKALDILSPLLKLAPRLLVCVIDKLQILDHVKINQYIDRLLDIFRVDDEIMVVKILITTSGFFSSGARLDVTERLDCARLPRKRAGKGQPGGRYLNALTF